ncbi:MAG: TraB/GumN family protein [Desulfomonile tiedjei]|uniref:TraB/GumN family protein n=1 Tax=Desulfomonile tiedjei TaxID=2358 RepID=A0A9D6V8W8_9BACT|nr:TraB/GumN family protein [Desulfomonile tiedjei]
MLWRRLWRKELRMVWRLKKDARSSFLVGTAHFSPHSFRKCLTRLIMESEAALFEGPLDPSSMERVVAAGIQEQNANHFLNELDAKTLSTIAKVLGPEAPRLAAFHALQPVLEPKTFLDGTIGTMKPWMAFFAIYTAYLRKNGWKHSVDMEAYQIANELGKKVVFMETIEEQIQVLESLSCQQMTDFLRRIDSWHSYTGDFMRWYLDGNLATIAGNPYGFPTRNPHVIDRRDAIFCEKMQEYLERGRAAVFVGVPHVVGVSRILAAEGYAVEKDCRI